MEDDLFFARDSPTSRVRSETINITRLPSQKKVECLSLSSVRDACEAIKGSMPSPEEAEGNFSGPVNLLSYCSELDRIFLLKEKLVAEIRRNHDLSIVVEDLDNKIALLVKNRISLQVCLELQLASPPSCNFWHKNESISSSCRFNSSGGDLCGSKADEIFLRWRRRQQDRHGRLGSILTHPQN